MVGLSSTKIDSDHLETLNLIYVYEKKPGIRRIRRGRGFSYLDEGGNTIKCDKERTRLKAIAVPPTYENVWYCPLSNGHLQATGYDSTQKKQYFYHTQWEVLREVSKYSFMKSFAGMLPSLRRKVLGHLNDNDLKAGEIDREAVLAAMVRILDRTGMRIGSDKAALKNKTFGLTTLRKDHADYDSKYIHFEYHGKGGTDLHKDLYDPKVTQVIDYCAEIPGQRLFRYKAASGRICDIHSEDVNEYIKDFAGAGFSAKDFRTWRFNCLFIEKAIRLSQQTDKLTLKAVLEAVAEYSGNTPSILKSSYIHPGLIRLVKEDELSLLDLEPEGPAGLRKTEKTLLSYLHSKHAEDTLRHHFAKG